MFLTESGELTAYGFWFDLIASCQSDAELDELWSTYMLMLKHGMISGELEFFIDWEFMR